MKNERSMSAIIPAVRRWSRARRLCVLAGAAAAALAASAGLLNSHAQSSPSQAAISGQASPQAGPGGQTSNAGQLKQQETPETAMRSQQQQVADEAASLLKMATDLKAAVDKTTKDTLSVGVVRKAGAIEQLAHKVRTGTGKS